MKFQNPGPQTVTLAGGTVILSGDSPGTLFNGVLVNATSPVNLANVSAYQSVQLAVIATTLTGVTFTISWYDSTGTNELAQDSVSFSGSGFCTLRAKGSFVTIAVSNLAGAANLDVTASYRPAYTEQYQNLAIGVVGNTPWLDGSEYILSGHSFAGSGGNVNEAICSRNGAAQLVVTTSVTFTIEIVDAVTGQMLTRLDTPAVAGGADYLINFRAPKLALKINATNTSAGAATPTIGVTFPD